jgi:hypothetical protein
MPAGGPTQRDMLKIIVTWSGPFAASDVVEQFNDEGAPADYDGPDYGLYQIYGRHILSGPGTLLYVGQATEQTFSRRFRHHAKWLAREDDIAIYLGRIHDPRRHTSDDLWRRWVNDVKLAECVLIYKYSPNYNSIAISDPPSLRGYGSVELVNEGARHKLNPRDSAPADW